MKGRLKWSQTLSPLYPDQNKRWYHPGLQIISKSEFSNALSKTGTHTHTHTHTDQEYLGRTAWGVGVGASVVSVQTLGPCIPIVIFKWTKYCGLTFSDWILKITYLLF